MFKVRDKRNPNKIVDVYGIDVDHEKQTIRFVIFDEFQGTFILSLSENYTPL